MNSEVESPSMIDVRKCLKEADSFDPTLNEQEMLELYHVLKDSQKTATEEDEQRRIFEQTEANCSIINELRKNSVPVHIEREELQDVNNEATPKSEDMVCSSSEDMHTKKKEKPFAPKSWSQQKKQTKSVSDFEDQISSTSTLPKQNHQTHNEEVDDDDDIVDIVDVFNSVPTTHKPLKRITLSPKYNPPFYCNPKITCLDYKQRARLISNYHLELLQTYANYHRQSLFPAPWGKAVQSNPHFNGSLMSKTEKFEEDTEPSQGNVSVDELLEAIKEDKSSEDDFETYVSKSGRHTKRKLYTENFDDNSTEWIKRPKPTESDEEGTKKVPPKKRGLCSLSQEEIMKRSKLFADNTSSPRTEKIFNKLIEEDPKKKEAERKLEIFHETLNISGEEDVEDPLKVADIVHSEEPFIRRRVMPPSGVKKFGVAAGRNKSSGRPRGRKNAGTKRSASEESSQKYNPLDTSVSTTAGSVKEKAACPVCFEEFFQSELLEHAPACLDSHNQNSVTVTSKPLDFCQTRISCETCDMVLPLDMEYADHVKECLQKHMK